MMANGRNNNYKTHNKGNNKPGRSNQRGKKERDQERIDKTQTDSGCASNDVAWYAKNPQLLKDAASLNFSTRTGAPLRVVDSATVGISALTDVSCMPGICTIDYLPSIGRTLVAGATDAVNTAAKNIYSFVRHANSGSANYDSPDLMMAILAATDVFAAIAVGMRAYGVARVYDQKNMYTPKAMLAAMGFDPDSVIDNLATFRYGLNQRIAKASVIWVPNDLSIVARRFWMNSNIYKDSESERSQFYLYKPNAFWKFDATTESTGSSLQVQNFGTGVTVGQYFTMLDALLDPIVADEDMGIMFGDMLKAYGKDHLYTLNMMPEDYIVLPVYNREVLTQIHNAIAIPADPVKVTQSAAGIISEDKVQLGNSINYGNVTRNLLDFESVIPEPADIMVATRMSQHCVLLWDAGTSKYNCNLLTCGTERAFRFSTWYYKENGALATDLWHSYYARSINASNLEAYGRFSRFDHHPILYFGTVTGTAGSSNYNFELDAILGDLDVVTELDASVLEKMHSTAILSEYNIPLSL